MSWLSAADLFDKIFPPIIGFPPPTSWEMGKSHRSKERVKNLINLEGSRWKRVKIHCHIAFPCLLAHARCLLPISFIPIRVCCFHWRTPSCCCCCCCFTDSLASPSTETSSSSSTCSRSDISATVSSSGTVNRSPLILWMEVGRGSSYFTNSTTSNRWNQFSLPYLSVYGL